MAAQMVATCDRLKATALASGEPEGASLWELTNDAFVCLRVGALQLGAVGVEADVHPRDVRPDAHRAGDAGAARADDRSQRGEQTRPDPHDHHVSHLTARRLDGALLPAAVGALRAAGALRYGS